MYKIPKNTKTRLEKKHSLTEEYGEMPERLNGQAWKVCVPEMVPRVRPKFSGRSAHAEQIPLNQTIYYTYILLSTKDNRLYIGSTKNLKRRILEHGRDKVKSTANRRPMKLICYEAYIYKKDPQARERFLKSSDGRKDIKKRLSRYFAQ